MEILKTADEIGIPKTAELYGISQRTITNWKKNFREFGEEGLKNKSKRHQNHPNKMPESDLKKILNYKKRNPEVSLQEIKENLKLPYSLSTIHKKINSQSDKNKNCKQLSSKFFQEFYIYTKQISIHKGSGLPEYQLSILEKSTGATFIAFSMEKNNHSLCLFLDYFINYLLSYEFNLSNITFYAKKSVIQQNPYVKNFIQKKYDVTFKFYDDDSKNEFQSISLFDLLKDDLYTKCSIKNNEDLTINAFSYMMYYNCKIMKDTISCIKPQKNIKPAKMVMYHAAPILIDNHMDVLMNGEKWNFEGNNQLIEKAILNLEKIGDEANRNYDNGKALDIYNNLILSLKIRKDVCMEIRVLANKCQIFDRIGEWDKVEFLLQKTLKLAEQEKFSCQIIKINSLLGNYFLKTGKPDKAKHYILKQLKVSDEIECKESLLSSKLNLGKIYLYTGDYEEALAEYDFVVKNKCDKTLTLTIEALGNMGNIYSSLGDFDKAEEYYKKAYSLAINNNMTDKNSWIFDLMGINYLNRKDYSNSILYLNKAIAIEEKRGNKYDLMKYINNLGNVYFMMGTFDKALEYLRTSMEISETLGDVYTRSISYANLSEVYIELKKFKIAEKYIRTSIELANRMKNRFLICHYYGIRAKLCKSQKNFGCARNFCSKGMKIAKDIGAKLDIEMFDNILNDISINGNIDFI
ncbi:MAG: tetratricopeptide repeat protein [Candidatus Delongbacteria bacterium]|nr:tetratricopeptide repeat protein [Candidatus Delongbacteria bacterium]